MTLGRCTFVALALLAGGAARAVGTAPYGAIPTTTDEARAMGTAVPGGWDDPLALGAVPTTSDEARRATAREVAPPPELATRVPTTTDEARGLPAPGAAQPEAPTEALAEERDRCPPDGLCLH
jgi:hypothetical protein